MRPPSYEPRIFPGGIYEQQQNKKENTKVGNRWKDGPCPFKCPR